jgi:hypothetical protein
MVAPTDIKYDFEPANPDPGDDYDKFRGPAEAAVAAAAAAAEATTGKEAVEEAGSARGRERKTDNGTGRR